MSTAADEAKRYLHERNIPTIFESLMTGLMYNKPEDHIQFMISCLYRLKQSPPDRLTWDLFVDQPPPIVDLAGIQPLVNGYAPHPPPGNPPERASSVTRRRSGGSATRRSSSKDRRRSSAAKAAAASETSSRPPTRPKSKMDAIEERLSTPLQKEAERRIPHSMGLILLFGGPGGARTQYCNKLVDDYKENGLVAVKMSDLVHKAFDKYQGNFPEWKEAKAMYDRGELLPDRVSIALLKQELADSGAVAKWAIIDGYPRTTSQIRDLEESGGAVKLAIILDFDEETLYNQTKQKGHGSATVNRRLQEFKDKTLPVAKYYDDRYLLHLVPGEQDEASIHADLKTLIGKLINGELKPPSPRQVFGDARTEIPILLVVGAPGSNKSEYCRRVAKRYDGFVHLSMGEIIRENLAKVGTPDADPNWADVSDAVAQGTMISSEMCADAIQGAIGSNPGIWGYVIDGYPRDLNQARNFEMKVGRVDLVLLVDCTEAYCMENMQQRAADEASGGGRTDLGPEPSEAKLANFKERTLPMLKYFDEKGKLRVVEGDRGVDAVITEVFTILDTALFIPQDNSSGKSLT